MECANGDFDDGNIRCRICWDIETSDEDPVVALGCDCKVSSNGHAHKRCLLKWFTRPQMWNNRTSTHDYHRSCEICGTNLSSSILFFIQENRPKNLTMNTNNGEVVIEIFEQDERRTQRYIISKLKSISYVLFFLTVISIVVGLVLQSSLKKGSKRS